MTLPSLARHLHRHARAPRAATRHISSTSTSYINEDDPEGSRAIEIIEANLVRLAP